MFSWLRQIDRPTLVCLWQRPSNTLVAIPLNVTEKVKISVPSCKTHLKLSHVTGGFAEFQVVSNFPTPTRVDFKFLSIGSPIKAIFISAACRRWRKSFEQAMLGGECRKNLPTDGTRPHRHSQCTRDTQLAFDVVVFDISDAKAQKFSGKKRVSWNFPKARKDWN